MLNLSQQLRLGLRLTPQQFQYLKLLQFPTLELEQRIKTELELNPMLELSDEIDQTLEQETPEAATEVEENANGEADDEYSLEDYLNDDQAGYKSPERVQRSDDEETYEPPIPFTPPLSELLLAQFRLLDVDDTDMLLAEEIIGNVDEDGYLRRELSLIVQDLNLTFGLSIPESKAEVVLSVIHAWLFNVLRKAIPGKPWFKKGLLGGFTIWLMYWLFQEWFIYNTLLGEPLFLNLLELTILSLGSLVEGIMIAFFLERNPMDEPS